jgi:glycopeptide antibiotics resistance protein
MGIMLTKEILFIFVLPIWIIIRLIIFNVNKRKNKRFLVKREVSINILFVYVLCLISITMFPLIINFEKSGNWVSVNAIPVMGTVQDLVNITKDENMRGFMIGFWLKSIVGNFILLLPLGVMLPILWDKFKSFKKTVLFAFGVTLTIEILQLLSSYIGNSGRAFDIDDIILNSLGSMLGFAIYNNFIKGKKLSRFLVDKY